MSRRVALTPLAGADVADAFEWYEEQQTGLGEQCRVDVGLAVGLHSEFGKGVAPHIAFVVSHSLLGRAEGMEANRTAVWFDGVLRGGNTTLPGSVRGVRPVRVRN